MPQQRRQHLHLLAQTRTIGAQIAAGERDRDRRHAERETFHRGGDGAGVQHVLAHVLAVIDAAQHEVGALGHQRLEREHHAVGRRAVDLPAPLAAPHRTQRMMQRDDCSIGFILAGYMYFIVSPRRRTKHLLPMFRPPKRA